MSAIPIKSVDLCKGRNKVQTEQYLKTSFHPAGLLSCTYQHRVSADEIKGACMLSQELVILYTQPDMLAVFANKQDCFNTEYFLV